MKKILATSGILTYMLLVNAGIVSAQGAQAIAASETTDIFPSQASVRHEKNFDEKVTKLALKLGLDPEEITQEVGKHKTIKQILKGHGISDDQLQKTLGNKRAKKNQKPIY